MQWFGESWQAPVNDDVPHGPTPVGIPCAGGCGLKIQPEDQGVLIPTPATSHGGDGASHTYTLDGIPHVAFHLFCFLKELGIHKWES
jgi:hypothetical protein